MSAGAFAGGRPMAEGAVGVLVLLAGLSGVAALLADADVRDARRAVDCTLGHREGPGPSVGSRPGPSVGSRRGPTLGTRLRALNGGRNVPTKATVLSGMTGLLRVDVQLLDSPLAFTVQLPQCRVTGLDPESEGLLQRMRSEAAE